jgi:DnaJ like chaperone protein
MASWTKWLWGGLGWTVGGPIGAIVGFAIGALTEEAGKEYKQSSGTLPGDFGVVLLTLCAAVMKSDGRLLKSELEYIKQFLIRQFGVEYAKERILLFKEILNQEYSLPEVCLQIRQNMDYASRLQLIHLLFGLANSDGNVHLKEVETIGQISFNLGIEPKDTESIKAMFIKDHMASFKILEIEPTASDEDVKKAYRKMALKYHPDKVHHLGPDFQKDAQEKFRMVNQAYEEIKKQRESVA